MKNKFLFVFGNDCWHSSHPRKSLNLLPDISCLWTIFNNPATIKNPRNIKFPICCQQWPPRSNLRPTQNTNNPKENFYSSISILGLFTFPFPQHFPINSYYLYHVSRQSFICLPSINKKRSLNSDWRDEITFQSAYQLAS